MAFWSRFARIDTTGVGTMRYYAIYRKQVAKSEVPEDYLDDVIENRQARRPRPGDRLTVSFACSLDELDVPQIGELLAHVRRCANGAFEIQVSKIWDEVQ